MEQRTRAFALRVLRLVRALPQTVEGRAIANQLVRSGTSVGANYRAAGRARTKKEFIAKLGIVEEEADETAYWLELIIEDEMLPKTRVQPLLNETQELLSIVVKSIITASGRPA